MRKDVDIKDIISSQNIINSKYKEYEQAVDSELQFPCCAWIQNNKKSKPKWLKFLSPAFSFSNTLMINQSNSFILGISVCNRVFAVTFGYAFSALNRENIETDFGLRVTLNAVNPDELDTVDARTIDLKTKQTKTHLNMGSNFSEFGLQTNIDWLKSVRGFTNIDQFMGKIQGSDSIRINWKDNISSLNKLCEKLLELYQSTNYKESFGFIDHLCKISKDDPLIKDLKKEVLLMISREERESIAVAYPEIPQPKTSKYRIIGEAKDRARSEVEEIDMDAFYDYILSYRNANDDQLPKFEKTYVYELDDDGNYSSDRKSLWSYIVAQINYDSRTYILSLGEFFKIDNDYVNELREKIAKIEDISDFLDLPEWTKGLKEGTYNLYLSQNRKWLLLDRKMFSFKNNFNKIECADILTDSQDFIHVKSMTSSATMSHLFAQGLVSADLLRRVTEYKTELAEKFKDEYGFEYNDGRGRVVYAIGTDKEGPIADSLFFFSMVHLAQAVDRLKSMNWPVAICKIKRK